MLEHYVRPIFQKYFIDIVAEKIARHIHSNIITGLAIFLGILVPIALFYKHNDIAVLLLILSGLLDIFDGTVARLRAQSESFGAALDIVGDRIVEFSAVFGLYLVDPIHRALPIIAMLGSMLICVTSFLVVGILTQNDSQKSFYYSPGLMERAEAFIFFIAMILIPTWFSILAWVFVALMLWTAIHRMLRFKKLSFI